MTTGLLTALLDDPQTALLDDPQTTLLDALLTALQTAPLSARETTSGGGSDDGRVGQQASAEPDVGRDSLAGRPPC